MHLSSSLPDHTLLMVPKRPSVSSFFTLLSDGGSASTKSTSQSEQRVKPGRYSALHSGQYMGGRVYTRPESRGKVANSLLAADPGRCPTPVSHEVRDQRRLPQSAGRAMPAAWGCGYELYLAGDGRTPGDR